MRSVWLPKDLLLLVPQSPLPQVPRAGPSAMARTTCRRAAAGRVLPCGLHPAPTGCATGTAEPAVGLWHSLPGRRGNFIANRRRPEAPRRPHRLSRGAAYLGAKPSSSSTPPLRRSRRRNRARPKPLDFMSPAVSVSGQSAQPPLPRQVRRISENCFPPWKARLSRRAEVPGRQEKTSSNG